MTLRVYWLPDLTGQSKSLKCDDAHEPTAGVTSTFCAGQGKNMWLINILICAGGGGGRKTEPRCANMIKAMVMHR